MSDYQQQLTWKVYVAPSIPTAVLDRPPGLNKRMWSPISATLIAGTHDAVLVDPLLTSEQAAGLVTWVAALGARRFDQIARNSGASRDILAARLRKLVEARVLDRRQYERHPPRGEQVPTEAGRELQPILLGLMEWGDRQVTDGPPPTAWEHTCGADLHLRTVCAHCGRPVECGEPRPLRMGAVR